VTCSPRLVSGRSPRFGIGAYEDCRDESHGKLSWRIFYGIAPPEGENEVGGCNVLVCNGVDDPFVAEEALDNSIATFSRHGHAVEVLQNKT
jgi:hypothetical protein